jgi:hypothetical protein
MFGVVKMDAIDEGQAKRARRSERLRAHVPVTLIWHEGEHRQLEQTHTVAVSRYGCKVLCRCSLPPGTTVRLEYRERMILGKISYSLRDFDTKLTELGIGFEDDGTDFWGLDFEA